MALSSGRRRNSPLSPSSLVRPVFLFEKGGAFSFSGFMLGSAHIMNALKDTNLKIAIQKSGRMTEESERLLHEIGLDFENYKRQLFAVCRTFAAEVLFTRDDDIPEYVEKGSADLGIVGSNMVYEMGSDVELLMPLGFGHCKLEVAVPQGSEIVTFEDLRGKRVATSYVESAKRFFQEKKIDAEIIPIRGSVEITPILGVADAILDIVATGSTLRANGLMSIGVVLESEAQLIACKESLKHPEKAAQIKRILMRIQGTLQARHSKYIMMNAPTSAIEAIKAVVPGLKSPTIIPLQDEGWVSIHTVVNEERFWEVMEKLHDAGARDVLVVDIEKIIR